MFLENANRTIREEPDWKYVCYISDRNECSAISAGKSPSPQHEIVAHGETRTMDNELARILLDKPKFIHNRLSNKMCDSYHCFATEELGVDQFISHIEPINSWECLMAVMGQPKYVVIIKVNKDAPKTI